MVVYQYFIEKFTTSSIKFIKFNIPDTSNISFVQETIDSEGLTKELKFYNSRHKLSYPVSGLYGGPIIRMITMKIES